MTPEERNLISGLFDRLRNVNPGQKDREAEQLIQQSTAAQPDSPYLLVQTLLVQEHALNNAQVRIQQLEKQVAQAAAQPASSGSQGGGGGGFLSGLFGHHSAPTPQAAPTAPPATGGNIPPQQLPPNPAYAQSVPPYPSTVGMAPSAGGGFLKSALTTAAGVAGGAVLFQGIENLLGHHSGPFGAMGGGGGFFGGGGGGGGFGGGYGGGPEIIENHEVINNYIDERGGSGGGSVGERAEHSSFLGGSPGFQQTSAEDNRHDAGSGFDDSGFNASNPFDGPTTDAVSNADQDDTPPTDDPGDQSLDNTYDADNNDAGNGDGGGGGGNDDSSSYV